MGKLQTSRRDFIKVGMLAGLGAIGAAGLSACSPRGTNEAPSASSGASLEEIKWDGEFDVVVVGFGAAGASAAISAAESGAQVLIIDKASEGHEGGNSRYCAQLFVSVNDVAKGLEHYQALRGDFYTPDDVLRTYVEGLYGVKDTLVEWGADASQMTDLTDRKISNLTVEYPELPGADAIRTNLIDSTIMAGALWRFLKKGVVARKDKIDCWYESPATALIQDPVAKTIVGVEIEHEGKRVNIAARNGVVLSLGGYENNPFYTQQYAGYTKMLPIGTLYNEGDGIRLAQGAGAKMWHMGAWESNGCSLAQPEDRVRNSGSKTFFMLGSVILVGADGRRYIAEDLEQRHGHMMIGGSWIMPMRPNRNFYIFNQWQVNQLTNVGKSVIDLETITRPFSNWSYDLVKEVESGRIKKADSIADLAQQLEIDADGLQATIGLFNQSATTGVDAFGRQAQNMRPIDDGPYYGMEVWPSILNSQGGPERTAKGEIVDPNDRPIPHLYSAGEFGGVTAHYYQGGGNMAECIVFGKISGANAAVAKDDAFSTGEQNLPLGPGSGVESIYDQAPEASALGAGEALGIGEGLGGPIWVKIKVESQKITAVEVLHQTETEGVGTPAIQVMPERIVEAGSVEVDTYGGATLSSVGVLRAVADALTKL